MLSFSFQKIENAIPESSNKKQKEHKFKPGVKLATTLDIKVFRPRGSKVFRQVASLPIPPPPDSAPLWNKEEKFENRRPPKSQLNFPGAHSMANSEKSGPLGPMPPMLRSLQG